MFRNIGWPTVPLDLDRPLTMEPYVLLERLGSAPVWVSSVSCLRRPDAVVRPVFVSRPRSHLAAKQQRAARYATTRQHDARHTYRKFGLHLGHSLGAQAFQFGICHFDGVASSAGQRQNDCCAIRDRTWTGYVALRLFICGSPAQLIETFRDRERAFARQAHGESPERNSDTAMRHGAFERRRPNNVNTRKTDDNGYHGTDQRGQYDWVIHRCRRWFLPAEILV